MLLRGSGEHSGEDYGLEAVMPGTTGELGKPVANAAELIEFAEAFFAGDATRLATARTTIETTLGASGLVDAAGIVAMFDAVVKVADATGIPLEDYKAETSASFRAELGIDAFGVRDR